MSVQYGLFALMTQKTTGLYEVLLEIIHELMPQLKPTQVMADVKEAPAIAVHEATTSLCPDAGFTSCKL